MTFTLHRTGDDDYPAWLKCLIMGLPKSGKGVGNGTPIRTPQGWTPVENLRVGDYVQGRTGPTEVVGVFPQGERPCYLVTTDDGGQVVCDDQHLWTVQPHNCPAVTLDTPTLAERIRDRPRFAYLPMPGPIEQPVVEVPIHPYALGLLLGDGGFSSSGVLFHKADAELHDALRVCLTEHVVGEWDDTYHFLRITGNLQVHLRDLSLMGLRSWEKFVPAEYLAGSIQQRLDLLAGLIDTDGGMNGKSTCFYTSSPHLRDAVVEMVRSLGGVAVVREKDDPAYAYLGEQRMGRRAYNVSIRLPEQFGCPFRLTRKMLAWEQGTRKRPPSRRIVSIVPVGQRETTCIKVAAEDGLFVTQDYLVTHNTTLVSTFPNLVIADVEAGLMSVAHKNLPYVEINSSQTLSTLLMILGDDGLRARAANQLGQDTLETVAIDTIDGLQRLLKKERLTSERRDSMKRDDWSWLLEEMREILNAFIALPMHVVLTVHAKLQVIDEEGTTVPAPLLQGAIADDVPGFVGFSLMTFKQRKIDSKGNSYTEYLVQTEGDDRAPYLGNRAAGRLPKFIEPDFKILHDAVYSNLQLARQVPITFRQELTPGEKAEEAFQGSGQAPVEYPKGMPHDDHDQPVHKAALDHLRRAYQEFDLQLPGDVEQWTIGKAREVMRWIMSCRNDSEAGKVERRLTESPADALRREVIRGLKGFEAYIEPTDEGLFSRVMTGPIDGVLTWVNGDQARAKLALDAEIEGKNRRTLVPDLAKIARVPIPEPVVPAEVDRPVTTDEVRGHELTSQVTEGVPEVTEEEAVALVTTELAATPVAATSQVGNGQVRDEDRPCEVCKATKTSHPSKFDLDIARLSSSRFGSWLCVDDYLVRTKQPNRA